MLGQYHGIQYVSRLSATTTINSWSAGLVAATTTTNSSSYSEAVNTRHRQTQQHTLCHTTDQPKRHLFGHNTHAFMS
jgi:hypothetical protein